MPDIFDGLPEGDAFDHAAAQAPAAPEQHGFFSNLVRGAVGSFAPMAAGLEEAGALGAHAVGWHGGEGAMLRAAGRTNAYQADPGSWGGAAGGMIGGLPQMVNPAFAATNAMLGAGENAEQAHATGKISNTQEFGNIAGQGALQYAASKLGGAALTGKILPEGLGLAARVGATALTEGAINTNVGVVQQGINKATGVDPNADVTEGAEKNFAVGALTGGVSAGAREALAQRSRMQEANGEPSAHPPTIAPAALAPVDPMAEFAKQLGMETPHFTDAEHQPAPIPVSAGADTDAELKARQQTKETEAPSPDTRAPVGPEAEADQATLDRIKEGMAKPDENPSRRAGESNFADNRNLLEQARIRQAMFNEDTPQRRAGDATLLARMKAEQLAKAEPQFENTPASEGPTKPGEMGTTNLPKPKPLLADMKGEQAAREEGTLEPTKEAKRPAPNAEVQQHAEGYAKQAGLDYKPDTSYAQVDPQRASRIASDYDAMQHDPNDPKVKASYDAFKKETIDQYKYLKGKGVDFSFTGENPYSDSKAMAKDITAGKLKVFTGGDMPADHPLAEQVPGEGISYNDAFRAVHDYFGHAKEGYGFGPRGEENAWRQHSQMYSPEARGAMTAETRGQNSWVNFGPHGEANQANPQNTTYAEQKAGLLPEEHMQLNEPRKFNSMNKAGAVNIEPLHTYAESTLRPAISRAVDTFTNAWSSVNTSLGTGEGLTGKQSETKLNILQNQGELDRHAAVVEQAMKPLRETFKRDNITTSNDAGKQWIDAAEASGRSSHADPEAQAALDMNNKFNEANIQRAKKLGMLDDIVNPHDPDAPPITKWSGDWIGRLYEKDDSNPFWSAPGGGKKSLQGSQAFLRGRDYDTYSQSLEAAQAKGLKPRYDNPADMMLAKQVEVARSLSTRELLRGEEDRTIMKWGEDGKLTPGDGLVALKDKSGADQRDIAIRKQDYAKYAGKMNGPEGQRFIKELRANDEAKIIRPGDPVPDGFVKSGVKATGKLYADPLTAHMFDSMIDTAPPGSAVTIASNLAKTIAGIQYMMGTVHLGLIATGHNALLLGKAADNAVHGELSLAAKNIGRAIDPSFQFGRKVRAQLLNPEGAGPEDVAGRVAASNTNVYPKSVLAAHNSWENAKATWEKDPIRGMQQGVFALAGQVHDTVSEQVKLARTQYQGALAETQAARGVTHKEGRATQAQGRAVSDAALGFASSKPAFQNQTYRAVRDLLFSAGQYMEGPIRIVTGGTTDALHNLAHVATGNFSKTEFTPRMQAILGGAVSLVATNAMIQLASTTLTTGKPIMPTGQDWLHARTGKKDTNGNDERVTPPGLATNVLEFLSHPSTYLFNRLNPVIRGVTETVQNKDFRGKQVYGPGENPLIKGAEHVAGEIAPRAIGGGSGSNPVEEGFSRYLGARFTNPSNSDAENFLRDVEQSRRPGVSQESAAKSEAIGELSKAWKTDPSSFEPKWQEAKQKLDLTLADRAAVIKRANEPQGLVGIVKNSELDPKTLMQGWDKMTDDERKSVYYTMRERVGSANIGQDLKQQYWAQLSKDREAIK